MGVWVGLFRMREHGPRQLWSVPSKRTGRMRHSLAVIAPHVANVQVSHRSRSSLAETHVAWPLCGMKRVGTHHSTVVDDAVEGASSASVVKLHHHR